MRWVKLHPYNISQKVQVVVEHYRESVQPLLSGHAKATSRITGATPSLSATIRSGRRAVRPRAAERDAPAIRMQKPSHQSPPAAPCPAAAAAIAAFFSAAAFFRRLAPRSGAMTNRDCRTRRKDESL